MTTSLGIFDFSKSERILPFEEEESSDSEIKEVEKPMVDQLRAESPQPNLSASKSKHPPYSCFGTDSSNKSSEKLELAFPKVMKSRKSISNQDISNRKKKKHHNKMMEKESGENVIAVKNAPFREHSGYIGEGRADLEGQYGSNNADTIMSRENSRKLSHETGEDDTLREKLKQRLISRIDFANRNMTNSDRSRSPHLKSVYSRQAQILSPGGQNKSYYGLSYSSNKSVSQLSSKEVDGHRRFISQGLMIANSRKDSGLSDQDSSIQNPEQIISLTKSPAIRYKQIRDMLHRNQNKYQHDSQNQSQAALVGIRPIPKSFKSSFLPQVSNPHLTPQMDKVGLGPLGEK